MLPGCQSSSVHNAMALTWWQGCLLSCMIVLDNSASVADGLVKGMCRTSTMSFSLLLCYMFIYKYIQLYLFLFFGDAMRGHRSYPWCVFASAACSTCWRGHLCKEEVCDNHGAEASQQQVVAVFQAALGSESTRRGQHCLCDHHNGHQDWQLRLVHDLHGKPCCWGLCNFWQ